MDRKAIGYATIIGTFAGLSGGLAEITWIWLYAALTHTDAGLVARAVADTMGVGGPSPVLGGVAIHLGLAATLGIAIAYALRPIAGSLRGVGVYATTIAALALVWAVNFLIVLPLINPEFVQIVPYGVSLVSKLLFGAAAAWFFQSTMPVRAELSQPLTT